MHCLIFIAFKADGSPREPDTPSSPCDHAKYLDFVQNIGITKTDKQQEETEAMKHAGNSYTNIEPLTLNFPSVLSPEICVSNRANSESADSNRVDRESAEEQCASDPRDTADACSDTQKAPSLAQIVDEVDSALAGRGQEDVAMKYDQGHASMDTANVSKHANEASESRLPEYMNLAVNMGHDVVKVLGAIPKKLPAPPVPPRGTTFLRLNDITRNAKHEGNDDCHISD